MALIGFDTQLLLLWGIMFLMFLNMAVNIVMFKEIRELLTVICSAHDKKD